MKKIIFVFLACFLLFHVNRSDAALPPAFDLRTEGRVTGVRNQGVPGPCWAFASLGACESSYLTQNLKSLGSSPDLSEMHLAYFMYRDPKKERTFTSRAGDRGTLRREGNVFMSTAFLSRLSGPVKEKDLPYSMQNARPASVKENPEDYQRCLRLRDVYYLSLSAALPTRDEMKRLIMEKGAIVVSFYSDVSDYHTKGRYYTYYNNKHGKDTNHDVTLAGWDDSFSRDNFNRRPLKDGAWLVRNSWGPYDGTNGGYFWMSYEQYISGGAAFIVEDASTRLRHYGYDDLGWCDSVRYSWGAGVFRVRENRETLKDAAFYTPMANTEYELYVYDLGMTAPSSPVSGTLLTGTSGRIDIAGYHTVSLPEPFSMRKGNYFSVVLKLKAGTPRPLAVEMKKAKYSENFVIHPGESYFSRDGKTWTDGVNLKPSPANACIKAFTLAGYGGAD